VSGLPRFHVPTAAPGARIVFPEHAAHHARSVLRLRSGDTVSVFDGRGNEWEAVLDAVTRDGVRGHVGHPVDPRPESPLRVVLAVAALKGDRMELVIQKATELGVSAIWPVVTFRTDAAARPALHGSRQERWEKVASGAAEQSGRAVVPDVAPAVMLAEMLDRPFDGQRLVFYEADGQPHLRELPAADEVLALVGPAGGFEPKEIDLLRSRGFLTVGLGPRILRAETAAFTALATLQVLRGDLA
jgi:16S rRNA (uracil1498-N3)-methyltransferase